MIHFLEGRNEKQRNALSSMHFVSILFVCHKDGYIWDEYMYLCAHTNIQTYVANIFVNQNARHLLPSENDEHIVSCITYNKMELLLQGIFFSFRNPTEKYSNNTCLNVRRHFFWRHSQDRSSLVSLKTELEKALSDDNLPSFTLKSSELKKKLHFYTTKSNNKKYESSEYLPINCRYNS